MDFLGNFLGDVAGSIVGFLPGSPFQAFIHSMEKMPFLATLNWIIPIGTFISIGISWLTCIGVFYIYQAILRWAKAIE